METNAPHGTPTGAASGAPLGALRSTSHTVYEHADGRRETIKNGFSWPAFVFGPLWAWRTGMFSLGFALLAVYVGLQLIPVILIDLLGGAGTLVDFLITMVVLIWIGSRANEWRRKSALDRGFRPVSPSPIP